MYHVEKLECDHVVQKPHDIFGDWVLNRASDNEELCDDLFFFIILAEIDRFWYFSPETQF